MKWLSAEMLKPKRLLQAISFGMATGMPLERVSDLHQFSWLAGHPSNARRQTALHQERRPR